MEKKWELMAMGVYSSQMTSMTLFGAGITSDIKAHTKGYL